MKTIIRNIVAVAALMMCSAQTFAQGVKIYTKDGKEPITIEASNLDRIETFAAPDPRLNGTWVATAFVTDKDYMNSLWGGIITYDGYPEFNATDELTFADGKITPNLKSDLKNYFCSEATYEVDKEEYLIHVGMALRNTTVLKVTGVNRFFSPSEKDDKPSYVAYELVEDDDADEAGEYILNLYLIDYESKAWGPELIDYGMYSSYDGTPYVANMDGVFLQYQFKQKK